MTSRTLPDSFPVWRRSDFHSMKTGRGTKVKALAQACNWLWANMVRYYGYSGSEGNGFALHYNNPDPACGDLNHLPPDGSTTAKLLNCFFVPQNWGPSNIVQIDGRSSVTKHSTGYQGKIIVAAYDLDGNYIGQTASTTFSSNGTNDWQLTLSIPQDKPYMVKVWMDPTLGAAVISPSVNYDRDNTLFICARYKEGTASQLLSGDTPVSTFKPVFSDYVDSDDFPMSSALLTRLADSILHLYTQRPPMILTTYLGPHYNNTSTFQEVGRYKVKLCPGVTSIDGRFLVWSSHGGAGNEVRVLVDGVVKETFTAIAAGYSTLNWTPITGLTSGDEIDVTVECKSTAASADWGMMVNGVDCWEHEGDTSILLAAGDGAPTNFLPVNEDKLSAYSKIEITAMDRLVNNVHWLALNRLKTLIQDWRHRTYKRVGIDAADIEAQGDWTRGRDDPSASPDYFLGSQRNITVFAQTAVADAGGSSSPDDKDGLGNFPNGESTGAWGSGVTNWPIPADAQQKEHGNRLRQVSTSVGSYSYWGDFDSAMIRGWVRARRVRPYVMASFNGGSQGPLIEEPAFVGNASIKAMLGSTVVMSWGIRGRGASADGRPADTVAQWYGPDVMSYQNFGSLNLRGRLLPTQAVTNPLEGALFEVELCGSMFVDIPLDQNLLASLP